MTCARWVGRAWRWRTTRRGACTSACAGWPGRPVGRTASSCVLVVTELQNAVQRRNVLQVRSDTYDTKDWSRVRGSGECTSGTDRVRCSAYQVLTSPRRPSPRRPRRRGQRRHPQQQLARQARQQQRWLLCCIGVVGAAAVCGCFRCKAAPAVRGQQQRPHCSAIGGRPVGRQRDRARLQGSGRRNQRSSFSSTPVGLQRRPSTVCRWWACCGHALPQPPAAQQHPLHTWRAASWAASTSLQAGGQCAASAAQACGRTAAPAPSSAAATRGRPSARAVSSGVRPCRRRHSLLTCLASVSARPRRSAQACRWNLGPRSSSASSCFHGVRFNGGDGTDSWCASDWERGRRRAEAAPRAPPAHRRK